VAIKPQPILKSATLRLMKAKPYVFLLVLVALLIFILGVRYGQKVEKTNKTINYLISLPPTQPPEPTSKKEMLTYTHKHCGISFIYPSWLEIEKETSTSALFTEKKNRQLFLSCSKIPVPTGDIPIEKNVTFFQIKNIHNNQLITFATNINLYHLIEKTLEFITPTP